MAPVSLGNTSLLDTLPRELRSKSRNHLEADLLQIQNSNPLQAIQTVVERPDGDEMIVVLEGMIIRAEKHSFICNPKLRIELIDVKVVVRIGYRSLAGLEVPMGPQRQFPVEWLKYDNNLSKDDVRENFFPQNEFVTEVLSSVDQTRLSAVPQNGGIFLDPAEHAFGQVYHVP